MQKNYPNQRKKKYNQFVQLLRNKKRKSLNKQYNSQKINSNQKKNNQFNQFNQLLNNKKKRMKNNLFNNNKNQK